MNRRSDDALAKSTRRKSPQDGVVTEPLRLLVGVHVAADHATSEAKYTASRSPEPRPIFSPIFNTMRHCLSTCSIGWSMPRSTPKERTPNNSDRGNSESSVLLATGPQDTALVYPGPRWRPFMHAASQITAVPPTTAPRILGRRQAPVHASRRHRRVPHHARSEPYVTVVGRRGIPTRTRTPTRYGRTRQRGDVAIQQALRCRGHTPRQQIGATP